jgi:hypothetical protein
LEASFSRWTRESALHALLYASSAAMVALAAAAELTLLGVAP